MTPTRAVREEIFSRSFDLWSLMSGAVAVREEVGSGAVFRAFPSGRQPALPQLPLVHDAESALPIRTGIQGRDDDGRRESRTTKRNPEEDRPLVGMLLKTEGKLAEVLVKGQDQTSLAIRETHDLAVTRSRSRGSDPHHIMPGRPQLAYGVTREVLVRKQPHSSDRERIGRASCKERAYPPAGCPGRSA